MWTFRQKRTHHQDSASGSPPCRLARQQLFREPKSRFGHRRFLDVESRWIKQHIATCKRCQKRFAAAGRVNLALQLARSQAQAPDLLARANQQALKMMSQATRTSQPAEHLKVHFPEPSIWDHVRMFRGALSQAAACIAIMALGKVGLIHSLNQTQARTQTSLRTYYTEQVGESMTQEIFPG